jgi:hypothetical protein
MRTEAKPIHLAIYSASNDVAQSSSLDKQFSSQPGDDINVPFQTCENSSVIEAGSYTPYRGLSTFQSLDL